MLSSTAQEIQKQYDEGKRDFQNLQLRRMDLRGLNLQNANLKGSDLSYANLREVNLTGADLREVYLNEADLTSANLSQADLRQASLIKTYLLRSNLKEAKLQNAYLTGSYLTKANLQGALLQGSYLNNAQLTGATLTDAVYDKTTRFDHTFDPNKFGLRDGDKVVSLPQKSLNTPENPKNKIDHSLNNSASLTENTTDPEVVTVSIEALVKMFNHLTETSNHYLGNAMTVRYWKLAGSKFAWFQEFIIDSSAKISYIGNQKTPLTPEQLEVSREGIIAFVKSCSLIIQNYTKMLNPEFLAFPIVSNSPAKKNLSPMTPNLSPSNTVRNKVAV